MKPYKTTCHICGLTMKTPGGQEPPCFCELCGANQMDLTYEMRVLDTTIATEAAGIKAETIQVILTNRRIFFTGDEGKGSTGSMVGWMLGGLIGGLIAGAISGARGKKTRAVSINFENMATLNVESGTKLLNKNQRFFTIHDKYGYTYQFQPGKKEADEWEHEIRSRMVG